MVLSSTFSSSQKVFLGKKCNTLYYFPDLDMVNLFCCFLRGIQKCFVGKMHSWPPRTLSPKTWRTGAPCIIFIQKDFLFKIKLIPWFDNWWAIIYLQVSLRCRRIKMQSAYLQSKHPNILRTFVDLSRSIFFLEPRWKMKVLPKYVK